MSISSSFANKHETYSRKQKSLGLLCSNFLKLYDREGVESVGLDEAAAQLGVERRRIYDIVNVLESVGVLSRKAKNRYSWKGFAGIPLALEELKNEALRGSNGNGPTSSYDSAKDLDEDDEDEKASQQSGGEMRQESSSLISDPVGASSLGSLSSRVKSDNRREKSLGLLTQNFVKLFVITNVDTIALDEAARLLLGDAHSSSLMRHKSGAKVRRLYDIANVLSSMNLIEKTHQTETKKPAFRWLGYNGKPNIYEFSAKCTSSEQPKKRAFGSDLTNSDFAKRSRLISSVCDKPIKDQRKCEEPSSQRHCNQILESQQQKQQQQNSKGYVFGPFHPVLQDPEKHVRTAEEWETLTSSFRPQYHNQALSELFAHYMEAWKSWYMEVAQVNNVQMKRKPIQQPS